MLFELQSSEATWKYWPHDFHAAGNFKVGKTCEIELKRMAKKTIRAHSYFNAGDIANVKVSGLGDRFIDKVNDAKEGVPPTVYKPSDRTDRVYLNLKHVAIHDATLNRTIDVVQRPPPLNAAAGTSAQLTVSMGDMPDDGYKTFVCVETALRYCAATSHRNRKPLVWRRLSASLNAVRMDTHVAIVIQYASRHQGMTCRMAALHILSGVTTPSNAVFPRPRVVQ